jgi:hypothetical protein
MTKNEASAVCLLCSRTASRSDAFFPAHERVFNWEAERTLYETLALHWSCYRAWPERGQVAEKLFEIQVRELDADEDRIRIHADAEVAVFAWRPANEVVETCLASTGSRLLTPLPRWLEWFKSAAMSASELHPIEREELSLQMRRLRPLLPDNEPAFAEHLEALSRQPRPT